MPEVERQKFCRTQNKQSVHKARVMAIFDGLCGFGKVGKAVSPLAPLCKGSWHSEARCFSILLYIKVKDMLVKNHVFRHCD